MKSLARGDVISLSEFPPEITHISQHGFWLLLENEELYLPFTAFPWFRDAAVGKIMCVEHPSPKHLYWPELHIDLNVDSIRHPERYPLLSQPLT